MAEKKYNANIQRYLNANVFALPKGSMILDAGCGDGYNSIPFMEDYNGIGIDIQYEAIKHCKGYYSKARYLLGDLYHTPLKEGCIDCIIWNNSIEHFIKPDKALHSLWNVLKPEGIIVVITPNYGSLLWILIEQTYFRFFDKYCKPYKKDVHPSKFREKTLRQSLNKKYSVLKFDKITLGTTLCAIAQKNREIA